MISNTYSAMSRPARENYWQDWANAVLAVWLFISPWVLHFGAGAAAPAGGAGAAAAGTATGAMTAAWNAWVLGVIVFLVSISAISRMDFWQEYANTVLSIWIFVAPWVLGFALLSNASWDHWVVGVLIFLLSLSVLSRARNDRARIVSTTGDRAAVPGDRPPGAR